MQKLHARKLPADVLEALRDGANLCPECLGHKAIELTAFPDFRGDWEYVFTECCKKCGGTGLDG